MSETRWDVAPGDQLSSAQEARSGLLVYTIGWCWPEH